MKISPISYPLISLNKVSRKEKSTVTNPIRQKDIEDSRRLNFTYGKDLVSFGAKEFGETIKSNYFRLPEGCAPDKFQLQAGKALNENKNVIVEAPTGTGKTAIAHYAVSKNMEEGKKTFYTTPLKALSNQKLNEFRQIYGEENVGILTGDRRENTDAPVIVMTTEVYRNMALSNTYGEKTPIDDELGTVIFDEFHYLGDMSRGPVWEESVMFTPKNVQMLALSATIGNPKEIDNWMGKLSDGNTELVSVPSSARHVPLKHDSINTGAYIIEKKRAQKEGNKTSGAAKDNGKSPKPTLNDFKHAVGKLNKRNELPAVFFVFSKKFSRDLLDFMASSGDDLTTKKEKDEIDAIVAKHKQNDYVGSDLDMFALKKGYAIHNAGIMPAQKALIEELFQKKLVKTVIATETLAAGINMPAKTVVISSPFKPSDDAEEGTRSLTSNEFMQMSGRAGRRGIDEIGYVYTMPTDSVTENVFKRLENSQSNPLYSNYEPDYAFLAGYYQYNDEPSRLKGIFEKSFYVNSGNENSSEKKLSGLMDLSMSKTEVLSERGFITQTDGKISLTEKGYMASKIRGYNELALTEVIANKELKNATPEAIVMFAAAVANPDHKSDDELPTKTSISGVMDKATANITEVYSSMKNSVNRTLEKLGMTPDDFNSFDEILEFADSIEMPEESEDELRTKTSELSTLMNKRKKISGGYENYSSEQLVNALKNEQTVPTAVLEVALSRVNDYKKRISEKDIPSQIERLEFEYENIREGKGKKGKEVSEKKKKSALKDLEHAKKMDYLDKHLTGAIASNFEFLKEHDFGSVKREYKKYAGALTRLHAKETLTAQISGILSINKFMSENNLDMLNKQNSRNVKNMMNAMQKSSCEVYDTERKNGIENEPPMLGFNTAETIFNWAMLNKANSNSKANWLLAVKNTEEKHTDEGSIYRSVMQTADLISQIGDMARAGEEIASNEEDKLYYSSLVEKASAARKLLINDPVKI